MIKNLRSLPLSLFFVVVLFLSLPAPAQQLLKDINQSEDPYSNEYSELAGLTDRLVFKSQSGDLFYTMIKNGVEETALIKSFSMVSQLTLAGDVIYFNASDPAFGAELWKTDGTAEGTVMVKDINPGTSGSNPLQLTNANGVLFFVATDKAGKELWRSDGTAAGTYMVKDIFPKSGSSNPASITYAENSGIYFAANDGLHGYELWKSDGTTTGTFLVKDIRTESKISSSPEQLTFTNGKIFFVANDNINGKELWVSDGTESGTHLAKDIRTGGSASGIANTIGISGICYFPASDGIHGQELWRSDGTEQGTYLLKDMTPGAAGSNGEQVFSHKMGNFTNINGLLFYTAYAGDRYYIWKSDGTEANTVPIQICNGPGIGEPRPKFLLRDGYIYYFNESQGEYYDYGFWRMNTDGSSPVGIRPIGMDAYDYYSPNLVKTSTYMYFWAKVNYDEGFKIFISDGTTGGTHPIERDTFNGTESSYPEQFTRLQNNKMLFLATENEEQWEYGLYATDGTPAGTVQLLSWANSMNIFKTGDGKTYISGYGTLSLFESDGTTQGTNVIALEGTEPGAIALESLNGKLFYTNNAGQIWSIDPVSHQRSLLKDVYLISGMTSVNGGITFRVTTEELGDELWRTNGTATGTYRYKTISSQRTVPNYAYPSSPVSATIRNTHYFIANDGIHGNEIWRTQGSGASTYMITDLNPNDAAFKVYNYYEYDIAALGAFRDSLYISAVDATGTWSLLKTNGTASGMRKVANLNTVVRMVPAGNKLFLFVLSKDDPSQFELWVTDGSAAGTRLLSTIGDYYFYATTTHVVEDVLYFSATYDQYLWRSDGTECGTQKFKVISNTGQFGILNDQIVLSGVVGDTGYEPFAFPMSKVMIQHCESTIAANAFDNAEIVRERESVVTQSPNPFNINFSIRINGKDDEIAHVDVFTSSGYHIESFHDLNCNTDYRLGDRWTNGLYILKVNKGGVIHTEKVIKR